MNEYKLGKVAGLSLTAEPIAIAGSILLFVMLGSVAIFSLNLPIGVAIVASLLAVLLHWVPILSTISVTHEPPARLVIP